MISIVAGTAPNQTYHGPFDSATAIEGGVLCQRAGFAAEMLPTSVIGAVWREGTVEEIPARAPTTDQLNEMANKIDAAVIAVYNRPNTLSREYTRRLADSVAYRDAGYAGDAGRTLANFANKIGATAHNAALVIFAQAAAFEEAELDLADLRMVKYEVLRSTMSLADATAIYDAAMAEIAVIAKRIG